MDNIATLLAQTACGVSGFIRKMSRCGSILQAETCQKFELKFHDGADYANDSPYN